MSIETLARIAGADAECDDVGMSSDANTPLHELSAVEICNGLAAGNFQSVDVVEALIARRELCDEKLNAFTAVCSDALDQAKRADEERKKNSKLPPLHGLPVTIKDNVALRGYDCTLGISERLGKPVSEDSVLVAELRKQGVIFLGKTNVPQALLAQETDNQIFGCTNNPWSTDRTPGGSSGGEAAAVASGMSPLGIGTDIGGSIRTPGHFCGIVGFKPSLDRWSNRGSNTAIKGQEVVRAQIGSLTRTVEDCRFLWDALDIEAMSAGDPIVPPVPKGTLPDLRGMTIGFVDDDDFLPPSDALRRALQLAKEALERSGARIVSHWPVASKDILVTWLSALSSDNARTMREALGGDPIIKHLKPSTAILKVPKPLRSKLSGLMASLGETRVALLLEVIGEKSVTELWKLTQRRSDLRSQEFDAWNRHGMDALLCPPHVVPAIPHGQSSDFVFSVVSMFRWNLLSFPAGVVPVTRVKKSETENYRGGKDRVAKRAQTILQGSEGLPVGVQLVAKPFQENVLLAAMQGVETGVRERDDFPRTPVFNA